MGMDGNMDRERILERYRRGDGNERLALFLYYRHERDGFLELDEHETECDVPETPPVTHLGMCRCCAACIVAAGCWAIVRSLLS